MKKKVLITGGAGFIGSSLIKKMDKDCFEITVLDSLLKQVHPSQTWSGPTSVRFLRGDVTHKNIVRQALLNIDYIVHLAAETGVGQSAYEMARHVKTNELGTAVMLEEAYRHREKLKGIIIASSRAIYGEGKYSCAHCGPVYPGSRNAAHLQKGLWEPQCPLCQSEVHHLPATEGQQAKPASIYGITKHNQEQLLWQFSEMFNIPGISLRFQNVYGPGQALNNPYTGILAVFSTRILSGNPIFIYEDGQEKRDFVYIDDVVDSIILALNSGFTERYETYNVGSGKGTCVLDVANTLAAEFGIQTQIEISAKYRVGDIRHSWADISKIKKNLRYEPKVSIEEGLRNFAEWVKRQPLPIDQFNRTERELKSKGLLFQAI